MKQALCLTVCVLFVILLISCTSSSITQRGKEDPELNPRVSVIPVVDDSVDFDFCWERVWTGLRHVSSWYYQLLRPAWRDTHLGEIPRHGKLIGMEYCGEGDEECLRRMMTESHLDYIYTQHHKH
ncbi:unnamed protein product [Brassica rapa]|uniref:Phytosulfokine n=2 Tax=Brassica TaxID=3705 RepID=A0A816Y1T7_BRANA|nr:unnamed protein product [Brassica napus]CAG7888747.1 unnamed protein product [Brassica rapa]